MFVIRTLPARLFRHSTRARLRRSMSPASNEKGLAYRWFPETDRVETLAPGTALELASFKWAVLLRDA